MLCEPERHEPLLEAEWDPARARDAIRDIVADTEGAYGDGVWPWHPLDEARPTEPPPKSIYLGASGVLWALWYLRRAGAATLRLDPSALIADVHRAYLAEPDTGDVVPSYFVGEAGILLVQWRLTDSIDAAKRLYAAIAANIPNPTNEALWAAPGTMLGALHMFGWTGEQRWRDLYLENVEQLWRTWQWTESARCHLWTQDLYGWVGRHLGAAHGFAGNAYALLRGADLLHAERREALYDRCVETLAATALFEGDAANWPPSVETAGSGSSKILVQWCHGAPGVVTAMAPFPAGRSSQLDAMLAGAGNTIWRAGPLAKGYGLCHGTAGNGCAFLTLHRRTGDAIWLDRARAFAMHAIVQSEQARARYGRRRHTLWTGDPGLAVYLWQCLTASSGLPTLDFLD